ncbi:hypothetical protein P353_27680 [Comamonas testosteroni]|uniref:Uncharacterized protein n=1 Tax=Comamonas testosteroni TaxID=285 RepID=A0A096F0R3_COMTE|nr:hypothetical protein P353_27680 [Comamonas testosteroni]
MVSSGMFLAVKLTRAGHLSNHPTGEPANGPRGAVAIQIWFSLWLPADQDLVQARWSAAIPFRASGGWTFWRDMVFLDAFGKQIAHKRACRGLLH